MRSMLVLGLAVTLAACGEKAKKQAQADALAGAHFTPPTVTSRLDFGGLSERRFRRLDRDHDGAITRDELPSARADRLLALDRNRDGQITASEWSEGMIARFDAMDLNRDGSVTSDERERYEAGERAQPAPTVVEPGEPAAPVRQPAAAPAR